MPPTDTEPSSGVPFIAPEAPARFYEPPYPPPAMPVDSVSQDTLTRFDPDLEPRIELSRTIPMATLWGHEAWRTHAHKWGDASFGAGIQYRHEASIE